MNIRKILSTIGFFIFAGFCSLQFNDVSEYGTAQWLTYGWVIGYAALAIVCLIHFYRPLPAKLFLLLAVVCLGLTIFRATDINWNEPIFCFTAPAEFAQRNPAGNEAGGLLIMSAWLFLLWFFHSDKNC